MDPTGILTGRAEPFSGFYSRFFQKKYREKVPEKIQEKFSRIFLDRIDIFRIFAA
jgi:hypothetical protein